MRVLMLDAAARHHHAALGQRRDDAIVGVALLAAVVEHARTLEAGCGGCVEAAIIDHERDRRIDAALGELAPRLQPYLEVVEAVSRRGVDEAGAGVVGDVFAVEQGHIEVVAAAEAAERVVRIEIA